MRHLFIALSMIAAFAGSAFAQQPKVAASPQLPTYGQPIRIELRDAPLTYLPATRYSINGSSITLDYEYLSTSFGPWGPDFGSAPVSLGELPPGNYTVTARLFDLDSAPTAAPKLAQATLAIAPPAQWGLYTVPAEPQAYAMTHAVIKSAAYFDPKTMRATVSGNVIRVDFDYRGDAPASGAAPAAGWQAYGSVRIPDLQPGSYRIEGWGRESGKPYEKFFEKSLVIAGTTPVVEYYSATIDHYFMAMGADEIDLIDRGKQGDWKRTGQRFKAWSKQAFAAPGAVPVCRFYARGANSHFFTGSRAECDYLKTLEQQQRAEATAQGKAFMGWGYEGIAFWALMPVNGQCPANTTPIYRMYNGRAAQADSNHRFTGDPMQYSAMLAGWIDENVQLCSPN